MLALFDEYCQSSMYVPAIFNSHTNFLQNISICYKLYAYLWLYLIVQNKKIFISLRLLHQPNQTESGYFQVRICYFFPHINQFPTTARLFTTLPLGGATALHLKSFSGSEIQQPVLRNSAPPGSCSVFFKMNNIYCSVASV